MWYITLDIVYCRCVYKFGMATIYIMSVICRFGPPSTALPSLPCDNHKTHLIRCSERKTKKGNLKIKLVINRSIDAGAIDYCIRLL